jgi:hypothetical protein
MAKKKSKRPPETKTWRGRPTKYDPSWMIDEAYEFMSKGYTKTALSGHLLITEDTLYRWIKNHQEFSEAVNIGLAQSQKPFLDDVKTGFWHETKYDSKGKPIGSKSMNAQVTALYARNVYKWDAKEKEESNNNFNFNLSYDPKGLKDDEQPD